VSTHKVELIQKSLDKVFCLYLGQVRKGTTTPYIVYISNVARYSMAETDVPQDMIVAGVLHDTLEDTPYTVDSFETNLL